MLRRWLKGKFSEAQRRDLELFLNGLKGADRGEVAAVLAVATHLRNSFPGYREKLLDPIPAVAAEPLLSLTLNQGIKDAQRRGDTTAAGGWMVWLHTVRSCDDPGLRYLGKQMWEELARGRDVIAADPANFGRALGLNVDLDLTGFDRVPKGLDPSG